MSFQSDTFVSHSEPTTLCGYICRSNRTHLFLILNQLLFADIYVVPVGNICFWFWTTYSLRVYMSFQSETFVSDSEPTTLCGYICRSSRKHLFLILSNLLFVGIYVVPIGKNCFWFKTNYSLRIYMSFKSDTFVSDSEPTTLCGYICRSNRTHLFLILNQLLFAGIYVIPVGNICFWFWTNYSLRVYMSFQSETFVSDYEPTTLCGYICRSNRTHLFLILNQLLFAGIYVVPIGHICFWFWTNYSLRYICRSNRTHLFLIMNQLLFASIYVVPIGHICFWLWTNYSLRVYMSFQSDTFISDYEPTTLCGYICHSNRTHLFPILNQLHFAGIYVVPIGHICFWLWTNYSLRVYMSFQSDTFVSDYEPTTLCGYICRSNRTHLFLILNQLLFAGIYVVPIGHICFRLWTNYSLRVYMSFQSDTFVSHYEPTTLCGYICRSNRTHLFPIMNQLLFAGIYVVPIGHICFWLWTNYSLRVYMSFQSDTFISDYEPTTLCGYICHSNRTHLFPILNQLHFAGIYVVPIGHICFWLWTNYSLRVYMSFQSDTFVSDYTLCGYICRSNRTQLLFAGIYVVPIGHICFWFCGYICRSNQFVSTTLCGYICRSNRTHLFPIMNQLLFAGIYVVPIGHICFSEPTTLCGYICRSNGHICFYYEPTTLCGYICRSNRTHLFLIMNQLLFAGIYVVPIGHICFWLWTNYSLRVYMSFQSDTFVSDYEPTTLCGYICRSNRTHLFLIMNQLLFAGVYVVPIGHICFRLWTNYSLRVYMSFQSDTFVSDYEPTTLCGYICRSNRTHLYLIMNQLLFAGIYVVPIGHICFWLWTNYSLRVYMSFQSDTFVSDYEPTTLCGYICRSNRTHLFLIMNQLLFAGIYVVPIGHICFWFWTNYSLRVYMSFQSDTFVSDYEPTTLCEYICRSNRTHLFLIMNQLLFAGIYVVPIGHICFWLWTNYSLRVYMSFQSDTFVSDYEPTTLCGYIRRFNRTHLFLILNQLLCSCSFILSVTGEATHNTSIAICLTRPKLNPTIYRYHVTITPHKMLAKHTIVVMVIRT